jgi:hypothetical protein
MYSCKPSLLHRSASRLWLVIGCAGLSSIITIGSTTNISVLSQPPNLQRTTKPTPNNSVIQSIRQAVKQQFGIAQITIVSVTEQNWPDGCLGLPRSQEVCTEAIVPGWRVEVTDNLQTWFYRSNITGKVLRLENPDSDILPQSVARRLIQQIARETNNIPAKLRITAVQSSVKAGRIRSGLLGWQAIVTSPTRTYVYNLSEDATKISQNTAASGAKRAIRVSFETFGEISPIAANEIFRSSTSGDLTGRMVSTVLTQDGKITRYQSSPLAKFAPVVIKTLSPNQLDNFQKVLKNRQFSNLNGLTYLTTASLADYPTTTYQSQSAATQFIDLEKQSLPRSLQQVIVSWESFVKPVK